MEDKSYTLFVPESHFNCELSNFDWKDKSILKKMVYDFLDEKRDKGIVLIGDPGIGKTHLLIGIFRELLNKGANLGSDILFIEFQKFVNEMMDMCKVQGLLPENVVSQFNAKVLIVDDVRPHWSGKFSLGILKRLIEVCYEEKKFLFMSTNANSIDDLAKVWQIEDYYLSRLVSISDICFVKGKDRRVSKE